jgi:uncharacterized protein (TIGR04255 family)
MSRYRRAPLQTATAEFRFRPGEPWDMTIPGLLYERLRGLYPTKRHGRRVELQTRMVDGQIVPLVRDQVGELQFLAPDGLSGLKVDAEQLAFQRAGPYPGWSVLRAEILEVISAYVEIAGPAGFEQLRLHFVNRIGLDRATPQFDVSRLLTVWPRVPQNLASTFGKFLVKIDLPEPALQGHLVLTTGIAESTPQDTNIGLVLDLDFLSAEAQSLEALDGWLEAAHGRIAEAFELCITDEARVLFQG